MRKVYVEITMHKNNNCRNDRNETHVKEPRRRRHRQRYCGEQRAPRSRTHIIKMSLCNMQSTWFTEGMKREWKKNIARRFARDDCCSAIPCGFAWRYCMCSCKRYAAIHTRAFSYLWPIAAFTALIQHNLKARPKLQQKKMIFLFVLYRDVYVSTLYSLERDARVRSRVHRTHVPIRFTWNVSKHIMAFRSHIFNLTPRQMSTLYALSLNHMKLSTICLSSFRCACFAIVRIRMEEWHDVSCYSI